MLTLGWLLPPLLYLLMSRMVPVGVLNVFPVLQRMRSPMRRSRRKRSWYSRYTSWWKRGIFWWMMWSLRGSGSWVQFIPCTEDRALCPLDLYHALPDAPGCPAASFLSSNQSLCHREREEDKEMAEFLQSKLSKSYLQKASRWLMSFIPCIEPHWQFLPFPKLSVSKISLLCMVLAYLEAICCWRRGWGYGNWGMLVLELTLWKHPKLVEKLCFHFPPGISQPPCPMRMGMGRCPFTADVLHLMLSNPLLSFHHTIT